MKEHTTHHYACDCREEMFRAIAQENAALRDAVDNAGLRIYDRDAEIAALKARIAELEAQAGGEEGK